MSRRGTGVEPQDELTEITKAEIDRVDGVLGPANGTGPLLMKSLPDDGSTGEALEELTKKKGPDDAKPPKDKDDDEPKDGADLSKPPGQRGPGTRAVGDQVDGPEAETPGKPGGQPVRKAEAGDVELFQRFIAERPGGSFEDFRKAQLSSAEMNDHPDEHFAYIEPGGTKDAEGKTTPRAKRHFLIHDKAHADNAAVRIAQGAEFGDKALPKVKAAQRKFGTKAVQKAVGDDQPGSPAWEAQDAALLRTAAAQLADLRGRVATSRDREAAEGEPYDWDNASDLDCAVQAIECALGIVARLAFTEAVESYSGDGMQKAGRMLSAVNATAIREAMDRLTDLLNRNDQRPESERPMPDSEGGTNEVTKAELDAAVADAVTQGQRQVIDLLTSNKRLRKALQSASQPGVIGAGAPGSPKRLEAFTPNEPISTPTPAGADLNAGFGSESAIERQQETGKPGQGFQEFAGRQIQNPPEPGSETPGGDDPDDSSGATMKDGLGAIQADVARQERFAGAPAGTPPRTPQDMSVTKAQKRQEEAEALVKSLLEPVTRSIEAAVTPLAEGLEAVKKQVEAIAATPLPGGPMLNGSAPLQDYHLRRHAQAAMPVIPTGTEDEVRKALEAVKDPQARDTIGRALALNAMAGVFPK